MCRSALAAVAVVLLVSCGTTQNKSYQTVPHEQSWVEDFSAPGGGTVKFVTLEFDEFGFLWHANQLSNAVEAIKNANKDERGAIVVTYVHGWHHSALTDNRFGFRDGIVAPLAHDEWEWSGAKPRPIVAIYIAWRGALYPGWRDFLPSSYYNRDAVANRIAPGAAGNALVTLITTAKQNPNTRNIIIGHSLGGEIVEHALVPALQTLINGSPTSGGDWVRPVDLVITINPAAPALEAKRFKDILEAANYQVSPSNSIECKAGWQLSSFTCGKGPWMPLIVTLTSEGDWATSSVIHAAKILATRKEDYGSPGPLDAMRQVSSARENALSRYAPGFTCDLLTHVLSVAIVSATANDANHASHDAHKVEFCSQDQDIAIAPSPLGWKVRHGAIACPSNIAHGKGEPRACMRVGEHEFRFFQLPEADLYWIVRVPENVIPSHSDIFNPAAYHLLRALMGVTGSIAPPTFWAAQVEANGTAAMRNAMGTRWQAETTFTSPSACGLPPYVSFDFRGPTCSGNSSMALMPDSCTAGEYTFDIRPITIAEAKCATVTWNFGDDRPVTGSHVVRPLTTPAVVTAIVSYETNSRDASLAMPVGPRVRSEPLPPPRVRYRGRDSNCSETNPNCRVNETVRFEVANPAPGVTYLWNFGARTAIGMEAEHIFSNGGRQHVAVTTQTADEEKANTVVELTIADCDDAPPSIRIAFAAPSRQDCRSDVEPGPNACRDGDVVAFQIMPQPLCGNVVWTFPDGTSTIGAAVEHTLDATRPYRVSARISSPRGTSSDSATLPLVPIPSPNLPNPCPPTPTPSTQPETCTITYGGSGTRPCRPDQSCRVGERITFTASCINGTPHAIQWDFGDGAEQAAGSTATNIYDRPGDYTVTAHATGELPATVSIRIGQPPPQSTSLYVVKRGDCLSIIAQRFYGWQNWPRLWNLNRDVVGNDPNLIFPQQKLRIWRLDAPDPASTRR